jgi:hypothetical protein
MARCPWLRAAALAMSGSVLGCASPALVAIDGASSDAEVACIPSTLAAEWSDGTTSLAGCGLRVAMHLQPLTLCWSPCVTASITTGCEETSPSWATIGRPVMERNGVGYVTMSTDESEGFAVAVVGDDGSVLAAFEPIDVPTADTHGCEGEVAALSSDTWVFGLTELRPTPPSGAYLDYADELHVGAYDDVASWSAWRASEPGLGVSSVRGGATTSTLSAIARLRPQPPQELLLLDASGVQHVAPFETGGWISDVVGIVDGRVLWIENEGAGTIVVQRDAGGVVGALIDHRPAWIMETGLDDGELVWVEQPYPGTITHLFHSPVAASASAITPTQVPETGGWNVLPAPLAGAAFGHGLAVLWSATDAAVELRVVDRIPGIARVLRLPATQLELSVVITSARTLLVAWQQYVAPVSTARLYRIDVDALPVFGR